MPSCAGQRKKNRERETAEHRKIESRKMKRKEKERKKGGNCRIFLTPCSQNATWKWIGRSSQTGEFSAAPTSKEKLGSRGERMDQSMSPKMPIFPAFPSSESSFFTIPVKLFVFSFGDV